MKTYTLELTYIASGKKETLEIKTKDLKSSMEQYGRNRNAFEWRIIDERDED